MQLQNTSFLLEANGCSARNDRSQPHHDGEALIGPWGGPQQMLAAQVYDGHVSIHDNAMAQKVGFKAATIEGPTHFSQFDPLCERLWGDAWFETGCISAHYRNAVFAGEEVQAVVSKPKAAQSQIDIRMIRRDGTQVLTGTASVGRCQSATALDKRLRDEIKPLTDPVILRDVKVGTKTRRQSVRMDFDQNMGELYPFSLRDKRLWPAKQPPGGDDAAQSRQHQGLAARLCERVRGAISVTVR